MTKETKYSPSIIIDDYARSLYMIWIERAQQLFSTEEGSIEQNSEPKLYGTSITFTGIF